MTEQADCSACGHSVTLHTDQGCIFRSAGTREHPPRTCTCDRTRIELRRRQELTKARPRITIEVGDITAMTVDAIVNAANEQLVHGGGVCGAIFRAAGPELEEACRALAPCPPGQARITPGFNARARWIVHAVGPVWRGGRHDEADVLACAYHSALQLASDAGAESIAFPAISTGIFGYPKTAAAQIAARTAGAWSRVHELPHRIIFCCFTSEDAEIYRNAL